MLEIISSGESCAVADCSRTQRKRGYCEMHYARWKRHGNPLIKRTALRICSFSGCGRVSKITKGYCPKHYQRLRFHGDPSVVKRIYGEDLATRFWKRVNRTDDPNECWLGQFGTGGRGYGTLKIEGRHIKPHRVSFYLHNGYWPEPCCLHSCDNPPCVNPYHLRAGTQQENMQEAVVRGRFLRSRKGIEEI